MILQTAYQLVLRNCRASAGFLAVLAVLCLLSGKAVPVCAQSKDTAVLIYASQRIPLKQVSEAVMGLDPRDIYIGTAVGGYYRFVVTAPPDQLEQIYLRARSSPSLTTVHRINYRPNVFDREWPGWLDMTEQHVACELVLIGRHGVPPQVQEAAARRLPGTLKEAPARRELERGTGRVLKVHPPDHMGVYAVSFEKGRLIEGFIQALADRSFGHVSQNRSATLQ